ncbi:outer membrane protein assembly factor, partial [Vibrio cholerae]|nr:outer membrane protein assembly factor [Vibrio cholerae]
GENMELPLFVTVTPRAPNNVELGLGFATDIGVRTSMRWRKPWVNALGHSMETLVRYSQPEQSVEFGYRIPTKE